MPTHYQQWRCPLLGVNERADPRLRDPDALKELSDQCESLSEMAEILNVTSGGVRYNLDKFGIEGPRYFDQFDDTGDEPTERVLNDKEELIQLYHGDLLSAREIAEKKGCHRHTVYNRLDEYDIKRHGSSQQLEQIREMAKVIDTHRYQRC